MNDARHSPTPWVQWAAHSIIFAGNITENSRVAISGGVRVAECRSDDLGEDEDEGEEIALANTEFIVRAANSHDDLVSILTWLIGACESKGIKLNSARKILAKATGK